jgi:hypothetical protein
MYPVTIAEEVVLIAGVEPAVTEPPIALISPKKVLVGPETA